MDSDRSSSGLWPAVRLQPARGFRLGLFIAECPLTPLLQLKKEQKRVVRTPQDLTAPPDPGRSRASSFSTSRLPGQSFAQGFPQKDPSRGRGWGYFPVNPRTANKDYKSRILG